MGKEKEILEEYVKAYYSESLGYRMMGLLLNHEMLKERVIQTGMQKVYIYGGGSLGIQLFDALKSFADIQAVIDINATLVVSRKEIPVIGLEQLKQDYEGEWIIITPIRYLNEIYHDLQLIAPKEKIMHLCEFLKEGV